MKRSRLNAFGGIFLAALLSSPVWGSIPPQPGTINYVEGQAAIGGQPLTDKSVGSARLEAGQSLSTDNGRAEVLLTPGIFLRVGEHSTLEMVSPGLADTVMTLQKGRAIIEVADIRPENNVRINENGSSTRLQKAGLYEFDADHGTIRVFDGKAAVQASDRQIEVKGGHQLTLGDDSGKLKAHDFDKKGSMDDFYRWASLRSSYLAEANVDQARRYANAPGFAAGGWYANGWYGNGWYWDPWYSAYTFIPGDGIFYDPFGWGFYSPWLVFGAPYFGYGYGYYHHFGPGYHPVFASGFHSPGFVGHAYSVRGGVGGFAGGSRFGGSSGFARGGGVARSGGFAGGGGFGGGGFHGGGGGHGR